MSFSALDYILWAADFVLAALAAFLVFFRHRKAWPLWILLGWWIAGDLAEFIAHFFSLRAYARVYFSYSLVASVLEFVLTASLCGVLVKERPQLIASYSGLLGLASGLFIAYRHHGLSLYVPDILRTELACCGALGVMLIVGWIGSVELLNREVGKPWPGIIAGIILLIASQALGFGAEMRYGLRYWEWTSRIQPVGELVALGLFIRAGLQKAPQLLLVRDFVPNRSGEKFELGEAEREPESMIVFRFSR